MLERQMLDSRKSMPVCFVSFHWMSDTLAYIIRFSQLKRLQCYWIVQMVNCEKKKNFSIQQLFIFLVTQKFFSLLFILGFGCGMVQFVFYAGHNFFSAIMCLLAQCFIPVIFCCCCIFLFSFLSFRRNWCHLLWSTVYIWKEIETN